MAYSIPAFSNSLYIATSFSLAEDGQRQQKKIYRKQEPIHTNNYS